MTLVGCEETDLEWFAFILKTRLLRLGFERQKSESDALTQEIRQPRVGLLELGQLVTFSGMQSPRAIGHGW